MEALAAIPGLMGSAGTAIGSTASGLGTSVMSGLSQMGQMTGATPFLNGLSGMGAPGTGSIAGPPNPGSITSALSGGHPVLNMIMQGLGSGVMGGQGGAPRPPSPPPIGARQSPPLLNGPMQTAYQRANGQQGQRGIVIGNNTPVQLGV